MLINTTINEFFPTQEKQVVNFEPLNEGVTEYFTRLTANAAGINIATRNNYAGNYSTTVKLVALVGEATVASAYFDGDVDGLRDAFVAAKSAADWTSFLRATKRKNWSTADGFL